MGSSGKAAPANTSFVPTSYQQITASLGETFSRLFVTTAPFTVNSTTLYLTSIPLQSGLVIGHIAFCTGSTPLSGGSDWWFGLYDNNRVQLATTADQLTATWAANTITSLAIATTAGGAASTFTTTYTGLHYLGLMVKASGAPSMLACNGVPGFNAAVSTSAPALAGSSDITQSTPPAFPHTAGAISATDAIWGYVAA